MKYKIGLDFGTTATKIAYLDNKDRLQVFCYPGPTGKGFVPTALVYQAPQGRWQTAISKPTFHLPADGQHDNALCEHFKVLLSLDSREQWQAQGWSVDLAPEEVAREYFLQLLQKNPYSFTYEVGSIDTVVIAIPEVWYETPGHSGKQFLQRLFLHDLGFPNVQLQSETVCALTYIAHCYQQQYHQPLVGTLLVCDSGGGSFRVTLCRVHGQHIEILDHDDDGKYGLGLAGVAFDRLAASTAYTAVHGMPPSPHCSDFLAIVRAFTTAKEEEHENVLQLLELQQTTPELSDTPLYIVQDKYTLDADQLRQSFQPLATHIVEVLSRLLARAATHKRSVDHVVLLGGFSQSPFVQHTILTHLNNQVPVLQVNSLLPNVAAHTAVVACGAAMLAQQRGSTMKYYPHTIGIFAHRRERGVMVETFLPFVEAGKVALEQSGPHFLRDGERGPLTIHVAQHARAGLPLYVRWRGVGEPHMISVPEIEYPIPGAYHLALVFDALHQASLLFKPISSGETKTYPLGELRFDLLVEG